MLFRLRGDTLIKNLHRISLWLPSICHKNNVPGTECVRQWIIFEFTKRKIILSGSSFHKALWILSHWMFNPFACKYPFILLKPDFGKSKIILRTISSSSSSLMWLYFSLHNWYSWTLLCIVLLLMLNNVAISLLLKLYSKKSVSVSSVSVIGVAQTTISNFWFQYQRTYKIIRLCQMVSDILKMVPFVSMESTAH